MSVDTQLARVGNAGLAQFEPQNFEQLERLAGYVAGSKLFGVATVDAAVSVMLTGAALGLAPATALRGIHVVQGKAILSSDLISAVILRSGQCDSWRVVETSAQRCVIETRRRGAETVRHEWTWAMAETAQLTGKSIWRQYPAAMLRARCTSEVGRLVYPDVLFGVYVEGELDGDANTQPPATLTSSATNATVVEPEPTEGPSSAAYAAFIDALTEATTVTAIVALWRPLADALRAEGNDPAHFMEDSAEGKGAFGNACDALSTLHFLSKAEMRHILTQPDGEAVAGLLDAMAERVVQADGVDYVHTAASWWRTLSGSETLKSDTAKQLLWAALARRLAGGVDGAKTKRAKETLAVAVKTLSAVESQTEGAAGAAPALEKWRRHIAAKAAADAERGAGAVAGSWLKHRADLEADGCLAEAYAATIDELKKRGIEEPSAFIDGVRHRLEEGK